MFYSECPHWSDWIQNMPLFKVGSVNLYFAHRPNQACGSIPQGGGKHRRHPGEEGLQKVKVIKDFGLFRKSLNA